MFTGRYGDTGLSLSAYRDISIKCGLVMHGKLLVICARLYQIAAVFGSPGKNVIVEALLIVNVGD